MTLFQCLDYVKSHFSEITNAADRGNVDARLILRGIDLIAEQGMDAFYVSAFCTHTEKYVAGVS